MGGGQAESALLQLTGDPEAPQQQQHGRPVQLPQEVLQAQGSG